MSAATKDPTENVMKLVQETITRLDDLRKAESLRIDQFMQGESRRITETMNLRANYEDKLTVAEAKRIDAIRAVDVAAVSIANDKANTQASILANQLTTSAETLRSLVQTTAAAQAQNSQQLVNQLTDRLATLGDRVSATEKNQYEKAGSGMGMRDMYGWIFGAVMALVAISGALYTIFHK
jgi:tetrahydromethanopterin S-methyltransferase subunit G